MMNARQFFLGGVSRKMNWLRDLQHKGEKCFLGASWTQGLREVAFLLLTLSAGNIGSLMKAENFRAE